jgi:DNA-directed RNA polymerase subunit M/transcription elongation factor TFIIS
MSTEFAQITASAKIYDPTLFRSNVEKQLDLILQNPKHSTNLERAVYNWTVNEATNRRIIKNWANTFFVQLYINRLRTIFFNMDYLVEHIRSEQLTPQMIEKITHYEMNPSRWDPLIREKMAKDKKLFENNVEANTDAYTCRKCRSTSCNYFQLQTRSCDEPMTIFVQCLNCGNRWRG